MIIHVWKDFKESTFSVISSPSSLRYIAISSPIPDLVLQGHIIPYSTEYYIGSVVRRSHVVRNDMLPALYHCCTGNYGFGIFSVLRSVTAFTRTKKKVVC